MDGLADFCASQSMLAAEGHFAAGTVFGDWRITAFIGKGGSGEVYCAEHVAFGSPAALKVVYSKEEHKIARFVQEVRLLSSLDSAAFPRFFSSGEANGANYMAMELLEPKDLPSGDHAVSWFVLKICDAASELHSRGIVHRDIKPGNILWRDGRYPVLADFGLIKDVTSLKSFSKFEDPLTLIDGRRAGVGTPGYGAPEQMERGEASVASDIHALGVLVNRCFEGRPPFAWKRIIERATSSIPERRYPDVHAFARAIRRRHLVRNMLLAVACAVVALCLASMITTPAPDAQLIHRNPSEGESTILRDKTADITENTELFLETIQETQNQSIDIQGNSEEVQFPKEICLEGKTLVLPDPIYLDAGGEYRITGPGTLDANLFAPETALVRLKDCVLINRTTRLYPENKIEYSLDDGVYLNFIDIPRQPLSLSLRDFIYPFDGAFNFVRFGGPATVSELMRKINEAQFEGFENF